MIQLPYPPTINTYYTIARGRKILSSKGRRWKNQAQCYLYEQNAAKGGEGPYAICISVRPPDKRKRDIDNLLKPLLDSLVEYGAISDDSEVVDLRIRKFNPIKGGSVEVLIS